MPGKHFEIKGIPHDMEGAQDLWKRDKYQFQKWAVEQVDGFCTSKRSADGGIDGRIYFEMDGNKDLQNMIVEVKGGQKVGVDVMRSLRGVLDRDDALLAGLIIMHPFSLRRRRNFEKEIIAADSIELNGGRYPRLQVLTVQEILDGARFALPNVAGRHELQPVLPMHSSPK